MEDAANQQTASVITSPAACPPTGANSRASGMCEPVSKHTHSEELNYELTINTSYCIKDNTYSELITP